MKTLKHKVIPYAQQIHPAVDMNDQEAAVTAVELQFPDTFSPRAWRVIRYMEGVIYLYSYKGKFVATDESLCLTVYGNGTLEAPYAFPRWIGNSLEELEQWLESVADEYDRARDIPGWVAQPKHISLPPEPLNTVLITMSSDRDFVGIKTYDRQHGGRGRFLVNHLALTKLLEEAEGSVSYEEDGGNYAKITHLSDGLRFSFTWLSHYGNGSVEGFRQDVTIPLSKVWSVLDWTKPVKHLYIPETPWATIDARPARLTIHEIVKDKYICRAFSKAMRDCFRWPGDHVTLYRNGKYSFYFTARSTFPVSGGLILHESEKDGHPYIYYSVHT